MKPEEGKVGNFRCSEGQPEVSGRAQSSADRQVFRYFVAAALFHALVRRDGVFEAMASVLPADEVAPAE